MSSSKLTAALLLAFAAAACHKGAPAAFAPQPVRVDPAGGPREVDTSITISGESFYARAVQSLSAHGGVQVDDGYSATLDGVPLRNVVRISDTELRAVVPSGLPAGVHALIVESPFGQTGTLARGWMASDVPPAQLVVTAKTPAQVSNGQSFTLALEVRNTGGAVALEVSPSAPQLTGTGAATMSGAAPIPQDIPGGESRLFSYALVASQAGTISVSATASGVDEVSLRPVDAPAASGQLLVQDRPALDAVAQTPAQQIVSVGQTVSFSLVVTNSGSATAVGTSFPTPTVGPIFQLVSSPAPQDIPGAMGNATFTWTYQAAQPGFDTPIIEGGAGADANDGTAIPVVVPAFGWPQMLVQAPAQLSVAASAIPAKVNVGQTFTVTILATNGGEAAAMKVVPTIIQQPGTAQVTVGAAPAPADIGGAPASFSWTLKATAAGSFGVAFGAAGSDANSGAPVQSPPSAISAILIQAPAKFSNASLTLSTAQASTGQSVQLILVATNIGEAAAINAAPFTSTIMQTAVPNQTARYGAAPAPQLVPGGATATWIWTAAVDTAGGPVDFIVNGGGFDQNTGAFAGFPQATSNQMTVFNGASLTMSSISLSSTTLSSDQDVTVSADVRNLGDVAASGVAPRITVSGNAVAVATASPQAQSIAAQATATFQWTFHVTGTGTLNFAVSFQGIDSLSGLLVSAAGNTGAVRVQSPAALKATVQLPARLNTGQPTSLIYTVTNTGQAAAKGVTATATGGGVADQTLAATPADIPGGGSFTFRFPYQPATVGSMDLSVSASGTDANSSAPVSVGPDAATATVQTPASLAVDITGVPATVNVNQSFEVNVIVANSGDSGAIVSIPAPTVAGAAASATPATFTSQTVLGHDSKIVVFLYTPSATGSIALTANSSGTDSTDGNAVTATPKTSSSVTVQTPAQISATLSIPQALPLGDTFSGSMTVLNNGDASANLTLPPALTAVAIDAGSAALVSGPASGTAVTVAGHLSTIVSWKYAASAEGSLQFNAPITVSDATDLTTRIVSVSSNTSTIAETVSMGANLFGDATSFASLASFSGQLWLGPSATGNGAVRMNGDGSGAQVVSWQLEHPAAAKNGWYAGTAAHTIGAKGCSAGGALCGPDNESGRGLFFSTLFSNTEWLGLVGAHVNTGTDYPRYIYLTTPTFALAASGDTDLAYSDLGGSAPTSATNVTSAVAFRNQLYIGLQDSGGPVLQAMSAMPSLPGSGASASDMGASVMPGIGGTSTGMIDSMAVFGPSAGDTLYLANANGFTRTSTTTPSQCTSGLLGLGILGNCGAWQDATPSALAYTVKPSLATTKTSDLEPADRAVPAMAVFGGRLFAARNTAVGPQLWSCNPSTGTQCSPGDWSLVAANTVGDAQLTQFNDASNAAITLLAATSQHLYVGFNNAVRGAVIYRAATPAPPAALNLSQFRGRLDGPAIDPTCTGPGTACPGFGGDGLGIGTGIGATRIFDGKVFNLSGAENLYVAAGTGTTPVRVVRATR